MNVKSIIQPLAFFHITYPVSAQAYKLYGNKRPNEGKLRQIIIREKRLPRASDILICSNETRG